MSGIALTGLPQDTIPDGGMFLYEQKRVAVGAQTITVVVPSGETWLMSSVKGGFVLAAGAGDRSIDIIFRNPLLDNTNYWTHSVGPLVASQQGRVVWGLGADTSTVLTPTAAATQTWSGPLPYAPIPPGGSLRVLLNGDVQAGDVMSIDLLYTYTRWATGNVPGGGTEAPAGPFLFVPGPNAPVAA